MDKELPWLADNAQLELKYKRDAGLLRRMFPLHFLITDDTWGIQVHAHD